MVYEANKLHPDGLQDLSRMPGPTSCRAGGTVQLMAATGDKLPVTLKMSTREHADKGLLHVVQVGIAVLFTSSH